MWRKHSRLFYAACEVFSGDLGCIFKTFNIVSLTNLAEIRNPAKITPEAGFRPDSEKLPDFCRSRIWSRIPVQPYSWLYPTHKAGSWPQPTHERQKTRGLWPRGVCPGSFGRRTIGNSRTEFNRILCTSKSEAAVTSNKKTVLWVCWSWLQTNRKHRAASLR